MMRTHTIKTLDLPNVTATFHLTGDTENYSPVMKHGDLVYYVRQDKLDINIYARGMAAYAPVLYVIVGDRAIGAQLTREDYHMDFDTNEIVIDNMRVLCSSMAEFIEYMKAKIAVATGVVPLEYWLLVGYDRKSWCTRERKPFRGDGTDVIIS